MTTNALCYKSNRPCRHTLFLVLALAALICIPQIALAGSVTAVKIKDDTVNVGQNTTIKVKGTGQCQKVRLDLDGEIVKILNHNFSQAAYITTHSWDSSGTKTVKATAKKNCTGTKQDTVLVKLKLKVGPHLELKKDKKISIAPGLQVIVKPKIESVLDVPLGALKPGTKLYLKGKGFGTQPGKILMYGNFPNSPVELVSVNWENSTQVNGVVPMSTNGQPNQTVQIKVKTAGNLFSDPWNIGFEGREEKVLTWDAVTFNCGTDGNYDACNQWKSGSVSFFITGGCSDKNISVCGAHANEWGAIGDDTGTDVFHISLKNGWVFKSMQKVTWHKSSGDETLSGPNPSLPVGQPNWNPAIHWEVTPNDEVAYRIKIIVDGPIGTSPY